jgi:hypothetical protein
MFDELIVRWEHVADGGGAVRFAALLLPGLAAAVFVVASTAVSEGSVSGGAIETAWLGFVVVNWVNWRGSVARRRDRMTAETLARRGAWDETIEFSRRPVANFSWRPVRTVWIATDRRLLEVSRARRRAPDEPPAVLRSVGYEQITEIRSVKSRGGGETARVTTVVFAVGREDLELTFAPTTAKTLLASVTQHTGLAAPRQATALMWVTGIASRRQNRRAIRVAASTQSSKRR